MVGERKRQLRHEDQQEMGLISVRLYTCDVCIEIRDAGRSIK
jgi:hypothetical protein